MTTSVFILSTMDMNKEEYRKQLKRKMNLIQILFFVFMFILFFIYLLLFSGAFVFYDGQKTIVYYVGPFTILFFVFFHTQYKLSVVKKGYFTDEQAIEFFKKCKESDVYSFNEENFEKAKEIYLLIFGTDVYTGEGTLTEQMLYIYNIGHELDKSGKTI